MTAKKLSAPRLLHVLAQARIARLYSSGALDDDPEIQRLRAEGNTVHALPGITIIIEKYSSPEGETESASKREPRRSE